MSKIITVNSEYIIHSVDEIVPEYYKTHQIGLLHGTPLWNISQHYLKDPSETQYERIALCDMNLNLWGEAVQTFINDTTPTCLPHHTLLERIINYILNTSNKENLGVCTDALHRLLLFHPISKNSSTQTFYRRVITEDIFVSLSKKGLEEKNLFWCLISHMACKEHAPSQGNCDTSWEVPCDGDEENTKELNFNSFIDSKVTFEKRVNTVNTSGHEDLSPQERKERLAICLEFVINVLESEVIHWLKSKTQHKRDQLKQEDRPLIAKCLWPDMTETGLVNNNVKEILMVLNSNPRFNHIFNRMFTLVAELTRISDVTTSSFYLGFSENCMDLAREYALKFLERGDLELSLPQLMLLKPNWILLLVTCCLLKKECGNSFAPDLMTIISIIEHILRVHNNNKPKTNKQGTNSPSKKLNSLLVDKYSKLKSVNTRLKTGCGDTRLHVACRQNHVQEVDALLSFMELDINLTNYSGCTALHEAASAGAVDCVQSILNFVPLNDAQRPVDTRVQDEDGLTPLMCAVISGNIDICEMLIKYSGSVLLEDVSNLNKTALNLSNNEKITELLMKYQTNYLVTEHSVKEMHFAKEKTHLVLQLCTTMTRAYLATYRTWDVYHKMKTYANSTATIQKTVKCHVSFYTRYHRDFKTNLPKLRNVTVKLKSKNLYNDQVQLLMSLLFLNKMVAL